MTAEIRTTPSQEAGPYRRVRTVLPSADSVLAVVARPGEEASYLGAILEAFGRQGGELGVLAFTRGDASPYNDSMEMLDSVRLFEFEAAASVLRAVHRQVVDYQEAELSRLPIERLAEYVNRRIREWAVDLVLTVDGRLIDRTAAAAACIAAREHGVPVLAWTLPHDVAHAVTDASGLTCTGDSEERIDFELRVGRRMQRSAMRAHQSQCGGDAQQLARLSVQGDREWLRWLVPEAASPPVPGASARREGWG
jgi:LmbE family N-acetylglucosaminyl deacetylase